MTRLSRSLSSPASLLGLAVTGASWLAGVPILTGIAIGGVAGAVAIAGTAVQRALAPPSHEAVEPAIPTGVRLHPDDERWIRRADSAVAAIARSVQWLGDGALKESLANIAHQAFDVLDELRGLAAQASTARTAIRQLDANKLSADLARLTAHLEDGEDAEVEHDLRRSVESVREQLGVHRRLEDARKVLQVRIESGALGLQQLAAQVAEMSALATPDATVTQGVRIDELNLQLESLRAGLSIAGSVSRRAIGGLESEGRTSHDPVAP